ncbi:hypothetical protein JCM8097_005923 [Rhodosporidiobolus ruineniae]
MADALADPSVMSWQELVDELAKQAASDDLLGVLLVLLYCRSDEVNGRTSNNGLTPLEAALSAPFRRLDLRILVVELLLLHGADPDQALDNPLLTAPRALFDVLQRWDNGRRDEARSPTMVGLSASAQFLSKPKADAFTPSEVFDTTSHSYTFRAPPCLHITTHRLALPTTLALFDSRALFSTPPTGPDPSTRHSAQTFSRRTAGTRHSLDRQRYIHEKLEQEAIRMSDIFLLTDSTNPRHPLRNAFVGVYSDKDAVRAINVFKGMKVDQHLLFADKSTDREISRIATSQPERRYVGSRAQANRRPDSTRLGIFMTHLPPDVHEMDIERFLTPSMSPRSITSLVIKRSGHALHPLWLAEQAGSTVTGSSLTAARSTSHPPPPAETLTKPADSHLSIRPSVEQSSAPNTAGFPADPSSTSPIAAKRISPRSPRNARRESPPAAQPASASPSHPSSKPLLRDLPPASPPRAPSPSPDLTSQLDLSSAHEPSPSIFASLSAAGLATLTHAWHPSSGPPATNPSRRVETTASFGSVDLATAAAASKADEREKAFPGDPERQKQFEVFLKAQTGETRDWYTVFFAQLAGFKRDAVEFAQKGHEAALRAEPMKAPEAEP